MPVGQRPSSVQRRVQKPAPSQRPESHSRPVEQLAPIAPLPAREQKSVMPDVSMLGQQPRPGPQPPSCVHDCVHIGPVGAASSQPALRQLLTTGPKGHEAPIGSGPKMSSGGTQIVPVEPG